ncbi:F0F1 ATP synthase subunit B [Bacteroidota bacterium]
MDLVTPGIGMIFWTTLFFLILLFVLGRFAWPAILAAVVARNESIRKALDAAEKAREDMAQLQADNEKILAEAKAERDGMMKDARDVKDKIIAEAREKAGAEASKMIQNAKATIRSEQAAAISEMKVQVAKLSVEIAEKILVEKLRNDQAQKDLVSRLMDDIDLN